MHTGPVGGLGGHSPNGGTGNSPGTRSTGTRSGGGMMKIIALLAVLLLGGGGGLGALLGGGQHGQAPGTSQSAPNSQQSVSSQGSGFDLSTLLGSLGGGSVSGGWKGEANTGRLNQEVSAAARPKMTKLLGNNKDTATIMVYM